MVRYEPPTEDPNDTEYGICVGCDEEFTVHDDRHFIRPNEALCDDCQLAMHEDNGPIEDDYEGVS